MKKAFASWLVIALILCMSLLAFSACEKTPEQEHQTTTTAPNDEPTTPPTEDDQPEPELNDEPDDTPEQSPIPYRLEFVSNGNGTCYISEIRTNPNYTENFTLEIPEKSPYGDTVTDIRFAFDVNEHGIPKMMTVEDYQTLILEPLQKAVENGQLQEYPFAQFKKYYEEKTIAGRSEIAQEVLLEQYPILAVTDIMLLKEYSATFITPSASYTLKELTSVTPDTVAACHQKLHDLAAAHNISTKGLPNSYSSLYVNKLDFTKTSMNLPAALIRSCASVTEVELHESTERIPYECFINLTKLSKIDLPDSVTRIGESAFGSCASLTSIAIPKSVTRIDNNAFGDSLTEVHITDFAAWCAIQFEAPSANPLFSAHKLYLNGELMTSLVISKEMTEIGKHAFCGLDGLTEITVEEGNPTYHSANNCLIETASQTLILGCASSIIPNDGSVTAIGDYTFYHVKSLEHITIPRAVTEIGAFAFSFSGLRYISIPLNVTSIADSAFYQCQSLSYAYYEGTEVQWHNQFRIENPSFLNQITIFFEKYNA